MNLKKLLFIYNAFAGKKELINSSKLHTIIDYFTANNFLVTSYSTQFSKDAYEITKKYCKNYDYVVCAGGDGTLNEITQGLIECGAKKLPIIGYIPTGSTNDFSSGHGIPTKIEDALEIIVKGVATDMDIGIFNGEEAFNYVAAFGLFTDVTYDTSQTMKNIFGHSAYILEGVKRLGNISPIKCTIDTGKEILEEDILLCMVTNSESVGGFKFPENGKYKAGKFHLIMLKYSPNLFDYQGIVAVLLGRKEPGDKFVIIPVEELVIRSQENIAWTLDGEFGGSFRESSIKINKNEVQIMLPE